MLLTGTINAAITPTMDRFNNSNSAYNFTGTTTCFISLPDNALLKPSNELSFSIWLKPNSSAGSHIIYTKNNLTSNFEAYQLCVYANAPVFRINKSSQQGNDIVLSTTTVTPGTWYHVVVTFDDTSLSLYINGVLEGTTPTSFIGFDYEIGKKIFIGATNESFSYPYLGTMDNLRFYNRTLNAAEVSALYNQDPSCLPSGIAPQASFSVSSLHACAGGSLVFSDLSTNTPTAWAWQVSGPSTSSFSASTPTVTFANSGNYVISLISSNSWGASNTATQSIFVTANPTITSVASSTQVCANTSLTLSAAGALSYTWNGQQQGQNIVITPSVTSTYTVFGVDVNGCSATSTVSVKVVNCQVTSIEKNEQGHALNVYPNPTTGKIIVNGFAGDMEYIVFDLVGKQISNGKISEKENSFSIENYPKGIYFLKIKNDQSEKTIRIVKE